MFRPSIENLFLESFKIKDESKEDMHFPHVLSKYYFFELLEGQLIEPKANEVSEER